MRTLFVFGALLALITPRAVEASSFVFTSNTTISAADTNYDGSDLVVSNCTVAIDGPHSFAPLRVAGDLEVEPGAAINADGRGYLANVTSFGPGGSSGNPLSGGGGAHAGNGGNSSSNTAGGSAILFSTPYDNPLQPAQPGARGGDG